MFSASQAPFHSAPHTPLQNTTQIMYKQGRPPFVVPKENPQALSLLPIFFRSHKGERSGQAAPIPQPPADPGGRSLASAPLVHLPTAPLPGRNPRLDNRPSGIAPPGGSATPPAPPKVQPPQILLPAGSACGKSRAESYHAASQRRMVQHQMKRIDSIAGCRRQSDESSLSCFLYIFAPPTQ